MALKPHSYKNSTEGLKLSPVKVRLKNCRIEHDGKRNYYIRSLSLMEAWAKPSITSKWRFLSQVFKDGQKVLHCGGPGKALCRAVRMIEYLRNYYH